MWPSHTSARQLRVIGLSSLLMAARARREDDARRERLAEESARRERLAEQRRRAQDRRKLAEKRADRAHEGDVDDFVEANLLAEALTERFHMRHQEPRRKFALCQHETPTARRDGRPQP